MAENKTKPTATDVETFLAGVTPEARHTDAIRLDALFREATGFAPVVWDGGIVGYGQYHYRYEFGRESDFLATGFAPRKANLVLYIMPGYADFGDLLDRLGPHRLGKSCLYITRLDKVDTAVITRLIRAGLEDLGRRWPITPT